MMTLVLKLAVILAGASSDNAKTWHPYNVALHHNAVVLDNFQHCKTHRTSLLLASFPCAAAVLLVASSSRSVFQTQQRSCVVPAIL